MVRKFQVCDWRAVKAALAGKERVDAETSGNIRAAINTFLAKPPSRVSQALDVRAAATSDDFPTTVLPVVRKFQQTDYYDDGWESVFDVLDFTGSNRNGFEILDIEDGLSFQLVPEGEKAKVYKVKGTKAPVTFDMYGGGLGWSRRLLDDEEYWAIENAVIAFRNQWYADRSEIAYALIEALSSSYNVTWQAPVPASLGATDPNYTAVRDIETINKACYDILSAVKSKGYGASPKSVFVVLYPLALLTRINRALGLLNAGLSGTFPGVQYNVMPVATLGLTGTTSYYVALPGSKLMWGDRMNLTVLPDFDPASYSDAQYGWGRYGGAIGDSNQIRRCATS